jgi:hypothetical protein
MRAATMIRLSRLGPAVAAASMACGGGSDGPGGPDPAISIDPPSATVEAGEAATTFTATRTALTETPVWTLDGPGTLSATSGDAVGYTPPATMDQPGAATLTATAGSESDQATITINPPDAGPPISVSGSVVDSCRNPVPDALVWIRNRGVTRTNTSGRFSFTGVQPPYDIGTLEDYRGWKRVRIYAGITSTDVRLTLAEAKSPLNQGALEGSFSVGSGATAVIPMPLGRRTWFTFEPPSNTASLGFLTDVNPYHLDAVWCGASSVAGTFEALQWTTQVTPYNPNLAQTFEGYGRATVSASNGMTLDGQDVALDSVGTISLTGTITPPPGFVLQTRVIGLDPGPGLQSQLSFNFAQSAGLPGAFTVPVPEAPGIELGIAAYAGIDGGSSKSWIRRVTPGAVVSLGMDEPPTIVSPELGDEVDLHTQTFTWTSPVSGVQGVYVQTSVPAAGGGFINGLDYQIYTLKRSVQVPPPEDFGLPALPVGSRGEWHVGSSNEPTLARLLDPNTQVEFGGGDLGVMLPIPEAAEVRFATATTDTRFTLVP